jgi:hypothetical protein
MVKELAAIALAFLNPFGEELKRANWPLPAKFLLRRPTNLIPFPFS